MPPTLAEHFQQQARWSSPPDAQAVPAMVEQVLASARQAGATDVHLLPTDAGLEMRWRIDGVLQPVATFPRELRANIVARLKVLAELLTYQTDVPQEGRIRTPATDLSAGSPAAGEVEMRVSTFPTLFGEKAVVRLFVGSGRYRYLDELGFPADLQSALTTSLAETGGVILVTGSAGSGKTTTLYACLREIARSAGPQRSLVSLEDPIEAVVPQVAQSPIRPAAGFDYESGLKSLLRQDPEVIMVGEIRDRATAEIVFQASLTGHLVLTTFHAGSAAEAVGRLLDMGIEPYQLRSGTLGVLNQRLVRKLCQCTRTTDDPAARLGLSISRAYVPVGCEACHGTGYRDRLVLVELLRPDDRETACAILSRSDAPEIERLAAQAGMRTRWQRACDAIEAGWTSPAEVRRVLGFRGTAEEPIV